MIKAGYANYIRTSWLIFLGSYLRIKLTLTSALGADITDQSEPTAFHAFRISDSTHRDSRQRLACLILEDFLALRNGVVSIVRSNSVWKILRA